MGRTREYEEYQPPTRKFTLNVEHGIFNVLSTKAKTENKTISQLINEILKEKLGCDSALWGDTNAQGNQKF